MHPLEGNGGLYPQYLCRGNSPENNRKTDVNEPQGVDKERQMLTDTVIETQKKEKKGNGKDKSRNQQNIKKCNKKSQQRPKIWFFEKTTKID